MWEPANCGSGKRIWFVCKRLGGTDRFPRFEYHTDKRGELIRYTRDGAYRKAAQLNRKV